MAFLCSYIVSYSGYVEYNLGKKTTIMNEKIKEFEEAIKNNEELDTKEFFKEKEFNYTNKFSNLMYNINDKGNRVFKNILKKFFSKISKYMMDD